MTAPPVDIQISYNPATLRGAFVLHGDNQSAIWERLTQRAVAIESDYELGATSLEVPWTTVLSIVREFAQFQRKQGFHFRPVGPAKDRIDQFVRECKAVKESRGTLTAALGADEIKRRLRALGFTKRE